MFEIPNFVDESKVMLNIFTNHMNPVAQDKILIPSVKTIGYNK